eukprot:TRINITY_DN2180_c2_g1_i1.p1 TRINITY_DN2180_c2_g1~~TRINITY_DN2180_c2_g1_i1.p1  ORF type:complete len:558 (+),score=137.53 TRINITY_DN2180_c2_g1_i1:64-1737(+)
MGTCSSGEVPGGADAARPSASAPSAAKGESRVVSPSPTRASGPQRAQSASHPQPRPEGEQPKADPSRYLPKGAPTTRRDSTDCEALCRQGQELLKRQGRGTAPLPREEWEEDRWPWPWLYAEIPHPKESRSQDYYKAYLKTFRILGPDEAAAWQAWKDGDVASAKEILADQSAGIRRSEQMDGDPEAESQAGFSPPQSPDGTDMGLTARSAVKYERHAQVVNAKVDVEHYEAVRYDKTDEEMAFLVNVLQQCKLFSHLVRLDEYRRVAKAMRPADYTHGVNILLHDAITSETAGGEQGLMANPATQGLWVVRKGEVEFQASPVRRTSRTVGRSGSDLSEKAETPPPVVLGPGQYFGENLLTQHSALPLDAAMARGIVSTYVLSNEAYYGVMGRQAHEKRQLYLQWLKDNDEIPLHKVMSKHELLHLADALKETRYEPGEKIIVFGERGNSCHFIVEGEVEVWGRSAKLADGRPDPDSTPTKVAHFGPGHAIGFLEFFSHPTGTNIADVTAQDEVITAKIGTADFEAFMGPIKEMLQQITERQDYEYYRGVQAAGGTA